MKWNKWIFIAIAILGISSWLFMLTSCGSEHKSTPTPLSPPEKPLVSDEKAHVGEAAKVIGETSKNVGTRADKIDTHADKIDNVVPPEIKPKTDTEIAGIKTETKGLRADAALLLATEQKLRETETELLSEQKKIDKYTEYAKNAESERSKLEAKIKDLQSSNAKLLKTMLAWVISVSVVGIGACLVIGFFFKTPAAFMVAAGCMVTIGVAVALTVYLQWIAWVGLILLSVGCVGAIAYVFYQIKNKNKAVEELVHTNEVTKTYLPASVREKVYGNSVEPGVAHQIQSNSTMKIVSGIRSLDKAKRGYGLAPALPQFWRPTPGDMLITDPYKAPDIVLSSPANTPISAASSVIGSPTRTILG